MTLRIMLLGLVASMGIELPSGADLWCWARSGRDWVASSVVDRSGPGFEVDRAAVPPTDCRQADDVYESPVVAQDVQGTDDAAFEVVSERMAADFAADLTSLAQTMSPVANRPEAEELACLALPMIDVVVGGEDDPAIGAITEMDQAPLRADRVSSAVRLTREAVQAWVSLIQDSPEGPCPAY